MPKVVSQFTRVLILQHAAMLFNGARRWVCAGRIAYGRWCSWSPVDSIRINFGMVIRCAWSNEA